MADKTGIAWASHTASPWHGCAHATYTDANGNEHAHQGCLNCYAEAMAPRNPGVLGVWGKNGTRVMSASFHDNCRKWNRQAEKAGRRASVFPSICDPFEGDGDYRIMRGTSKTAFEHEVCVCHACGKYVSYVGHCECLKDERLPRKATLANLRRDLFATIDACPMLDFLLLTKRPQNVRGMWPMSYDCPADQAIWLRPNVHLLTSISTQADADALIPHLLACRELVPVLGVSVEPLLGEIDFRIPNWSQCQIPYVNKIAAQERYNVLTGEVTTEHGNTFKSSDGPTLDWVICGNESKGKGVGRLPGGTEEGYWRAARSLVEQCRAAGVAVFHKQGPVDGKTSHSPNDWPEFARTQEFPRGNYANRNMETHSWI